MCIGGACAQSFDLNLQFRKNMPIHCWAIFMTISSKQKTESQVLVRSILRGYPGYCHCHVQKERKMEKVKPTWAVSNQSGKNHMQSVGICSIATLGSLVFFHNRFSAVGPKLPVSWLKSNSWNLWKTPHFNRVDFTQETGDWHRGNLSKNSECSAVGWKHRCHWMKMIRKT